MHTWTFLMTWTMPVPICEQPASFLHQDHGFEWHFWFWGYHDHFQWWGHTCTWNSSILKELCLHWTLDIDYKLFNLYPLFNKLLSNWNMYVLKCFNHLTCMILTWWSTEIGSFISEQGAFPLVIVWVWQWGVWKHAPM